MSDADDEAVPAGWALGDESWDFHRSFAARFGRPMAFGEYSSLVGQFIRGRVAWLAVRVALAELRDGSVVMIAGDRWRLAAVLPDDVDPEAYARAHGAELAAAALAVQQERARLAYFAKRRREAAAVRLARQAAVERAAAAAGLAVTALEGAGRPSGPGGVAKPAKAVGPPAQSRAGRNGHGGAVQPASAPVAPEGTARAPSPRPELAPRPQAAGALADRLARRGIVAETAVKDRLAKTHTRG